MKVIIKLELFIIAVITGPLLLKPHVTLIVLDSTDGELIIIVERNQVIGIGSQLVAVARLEVTTHLITTTIGGVVIVTMLPDIILLFHITPPGLVVIVEVEISHGMVKSHT
jgi:hypothetical protein